ncbi:MAG: branched-chain amino acid ABC transporter ATP-binding protein/permease [Acidimicrobiales bacterium]
MRISGDGLRSRKVRQILRRPWLPVAIGIVVVVLPALGANLSVLRQVALIAIFAMVISGLNLSFGYAGELQFSQIFMFALGAYSGVAFASHVVNDLILAMLFAGIMAAIAGAVIAIPAIRIGGWALAMASFLLVVTIPELVNLLPKYSGGLQGLTDVPLPQLFGRELGTTGLYLVIVIVCLVWFLLYRNVVMSQYGVIFRILRESPVLSQSLGFSVLRLKVLAYVASAAPAGVAGCLFAFISEIVDPNTFSIQLAIGILAGAVLGGAESVYGAVVGAAILELGPLSSLSFAQYADIAYGVFLIVAAVAFRGGLSRSGRLLLARIEKYVGSAQTLADDTPRTPPISTEEPRQGGEAPQGLPLRPLVDLGPASAASPRGGDGLGEGQGLVVEGMSKAFGGVQALTDVSLAAPPGQITALIGANGSGKTTVLNLISGYARADAGAARLGGRTLGACRPEEVARLGVRRTFQTPTIPRGATVLEVVASGRFADSPVSPLATAMRLPKYWRTQKSSRDEALEALRVVGLVSVAEVEATSLPLGTRRMVEVARALAGRPRLLLLDEPASGLTEREVEALGLILLAAAERQIAVLLVEHNFEFVISVSDTVYVLELGRRIAAAPASEVAAIPAVISSYLGEDMAVLSQTTDPKVGGVWAP